MAGRRHHCSDRCVAMANAYQSGLTLKEVGAYFHMTRQRVHQLLMAHGCPRRHRNYGRTLSNVARGEIVRLWKKGLDPLQVATKVRVHYSTVYQVLRENGLKRRPKRRRLTPSLSRGVACP